MPALGLLDILVEEVQLIREVRGHLGVFIKAVVN